MDTATRIRQRLDQPDAIEHITEMVRANGQITRKQLAEGLCEEFKFYNTRGKAHIHSCVRALHSIETEGLITLPVKQARARTGPKHERLWQEVPEAQGVPERVDEISDLRLELVETEEQRKLWNELMIREHPLGLGWMTGRRVRYLALSEHGVVGALGFGSSALNLAAREAWIGWNGHQKRSHLDRVIGMNRFLIRPHVRCSNLASCVLGMAVDRLGTDFEQAYHYKPWLLETFVDLSEYDGTCYQAANWVRIGQTCGRGRQDRFRCADKTVKAIYVYELEADFRSLMGLAPDAGEVALPLRQEADATNWAEREFGEAELGDKRLTKRLVKIADAKAATPGKSCAKTVANWTDTMGYYRFVEHPDTEAVTMPSVLAPHRDRTIRRMKACKTVLTIQDATDLDYSPNRDCKGLGVIGKNQTGTKTRGLRLHSTFAVDGSGLPLGILRADCYAPELKPERRGKDARYIPIEQKDTYRWIEAQNDVAAVASELRGVRVVSIADREADFFEHFHSWDPDSGVELLIRAKHDRATDGSLKMFAAVEQTPVRGELRLEISRRSKRPKKGSRSARPARTRRDAEVVVRYMPVTIRPPAHGLSSKKPPVQAYLIHVHEPNPPANAQDPINWYLLTTLKIDSPGAAEQCVKWYCLRWRIEDWHRVLKSGCRVEASRLKTAERLKREIAIDMVVAWRIMLMTLLGRELPELPADILFSEMEIDVLRRVAKKRASNRPIALAKQST